ncbi:hypothetical protein JCM8097_001192 [Rhodosporidiobolus ruineniae]
MDATPPPPAQPQVVMEGFLLKKKRKKMQGMARRYFRLSASGALSYAFNPQSPIRDSIFVSLAFISASRKARTIHIDGGQHVWHCKALTLEDFDRWAAALKRFINIAQDHAAAHQQQHVSFAPTVETPGGGFAGGVQSPELGGGPGVGSEELQKVYEALGKMQQPIHDLELVCTELRQAEQHQQQTHSHLAVPSPPQLPTSPSNGNGNGSKLRGFLGKRSNSTSHPRDLPHPVAGSRSPSFSAASTSSHASSTTAAGPPILPPISGISSQSVQKQDPSAGLPSAFSPASPESPAYFDARPGIPSSPPALHPPAASHSNDLLLRQFQSALSVLRNSHDELVTALHSLPRTPTHPYQQHPYQSSPLASPSAAAYASRSPSGLGFVPSHRHAPSRASTSRASFSSFFSAHEGAGDEWHDAASIAGGVLPGEFVLAEEPASYDDPSSLSSSGSAAADEERRRARETSPGASSGSSDSEASEGEDYESGEETEEEFHDDRAAAASSDTATLSGREGQKKDEGGAASSSSLIALQGKQVQRRSQLPSPVAGDEFSVLSMLRKNVGKDLSTISFPVTMNEPLSALERLAEELEYSELLDAAAATTDPIERLTLVAVFAISGSSGNKFRSSRKPFNPLLGETYECIRPEKGFQFISEKVSHHPPVLAFHGAAPQKGWQAFGHIAPSQTFYGRSMEIFVHGDYFVRFDDTGETYNIKKPSSFVRNLVVGTKYLEIVGDLVVTSSSSSAQAVISFKEGSTWGGTASRNKIEGRIVDDQGRTAVELVGRWDDAVDKKEGKNNFTRLWQIGESPPNPERYYGFSRFAVTLNELTSIEEGQLAPSDSRLRPDQRAFEHGDVDEAERLKALVEEKQRARRKEGKAAEPRWFAKEGEKWQYGGDYFDVRAKKAFEDPGIFV